MSSLRCLVRSGDARGRGDLSLTLLGLRCGDGLRPARRRSGERRRACELSRCSRSSCRPSLSRERRLAGRADASLCRLRDGDRRRLWGLRIMLCHGSVVLIEGLNSSVMSVITPSRCIKHQVMLIPYLAGDSRLGRLSSRLLRDSVRRLSLTGEGLRLPITKLNG